jgi:hypothetical protein
MPTSSSMSPLQFAFEMCRLTLSPAACADLDRLTARLASIAGRSGIDPANALTSFAKIVDQAAPDLPPEESRALSVYAAFGMLRNQSKTGSQISSDPGRAGSAQSSQLIQATKQMQETQMSFNLQYLQLQSQMQSQTRYFQIVSNIMKTRHDTVKNTISNIR